jgi:hypothetical protein
MLFSVEEVGRLVTKSGLLLAGVRARLLELVPVARPTRDLGVGVPTIAVVGLSSVLNTALYITYLQIHLSNLNYNNIIILSRLKYH